MTYANGRVIHDADSHVMETRDWLERFIEPNYADKLQSVLGEKAAKRATEIRDRRPQIEAFYLSLSKVQTKTETPVPPLPTTPAPTPQLPTPDLPKALEAPKAEQPRPPEATKAGEPK